jgi:hypothetical protein
MIVKAAGHSWAGHVVWLREMRNAYEVFNQMVIIYFMCELFSDAVSSLD